MQFQLHKSWLSNLSVIHGNIIIKSGKYFACNVANMQIELPTYGKIRMSLISYVASCMLFHYKSEVSFLELGAGSSMIQIQWINYKI